MARFKLGVAKEAYRRLEKESFRETPAAWYLYAASTVIFARAAIDALLEADGQQNPLIAEEWKNLFDSEAKTHPVFVHVLDGERNRLSHGQVGTALHPFGQVDSVFRHSFENAFKDPPVWPDGPFMGTAIDDVLHKALKTVSQWIDAVGANAQRRAPPRQIPEGEFDD